MTTVQIIEANSEINIKVDGLRVLKVNSKTEAQLIAQAAASGLIASELYFITDTNKIAFALTTSTYEYIEAVAAATWGAIGGTLSTQTDLQTALNAKAATVHTHTASQITDFDAEVADNSDVAANTAARHSHSNKTVLDNTTASFLTAQETKLGHISITQAVNLDTIESDTATNNAKVSNATHTGDVTGSTTLTIDKTAITGKTAATVTTNDLVLISDVDDSNNLKKVTAGAIAALASAGATVWGAITGTLSDQTDLQTALDGKVDENVAITEATKTKITYDAKGLVTGGADATTADIAASADKNYVTDAQLTVIGNTSGVNSGDVTVTDSSEIDFTLTGQQITASLIAGSIDETKLDSSVNASLDLADSALQSSAIGSSIQAYNANLTKRSISVTIDGGGSAITTGIKTDVIIPFGMTITGWTILGDQTGSIVVDVWKDTYTNYPPTVADTITGTEKPTLSSALKNQDNTLSSWTTTVTAGDTLRFNVDSASTVTRVYLIIEGVLS